MNQLMSRDRDFYKDIVKIAVPIAIQNLIVFGLNMLDTVMLGAVGELELAAVGQANQPFFIFTLFMFGISSGGCILISQYWGKNDRKTISSIVGFSITIATIISIFATVAVLIFPDQIMQIYINEEEVIALGARYLRIIAPSYILSAVSTTYLSLIRGTEQVSIPLKINAMSLGINAVLNYIFIFGKLGFPAMGVEGAAIATLIARVIECGLVIVIATKKDAIIKLKVSDFCRMNKLLVKDFLKYSGPVIINETLWGIGVSIYAVILGQLGSSAVASYNVVQVLEKLANVALFGISNATIIILGKKIGSQKYNNNQIMVYAKTVVTLALLCGFFFGGALILSSPVIFSMYKLPPETIQTAKTMLLIIGATLFMRSMSNIAIVGVLRSGGDSKFTLFVDLSALWCIGIPCGLIAAFVFHAPAVVVFGCFTTELVYKSIVCLFRIKSRKWIKDVTR